MPTSHAVSALKHKHSEIQGEIQIIEQQLEDLTEKLNALEVSIKIFDPEFKLHEIRAKKKNQRTFGINKGEIPAIVGEYVRLADKDFTVNDLVEHVYYRKPELENSGKGAIRQSVAQSLRRFADRNVIVEVGRDAVVGSPIIWRSIC